jgi:2-amino-4-hydroxy-6-hydroxymethyldihydropteridine diphosphokinase
VERIFLGLGSNQGESRVILSDALRVLGQGLVRLRSSSVWESEARYVLEQPAFFNLVAEAWTDLEPEALLDFTSGIEARFGRDRSKELLKGPRRLDIDILLYGERVVETERLSLPHPGLRDRKFVLLPLLELDAGLVHPVSQIPLMATLAALGPQGIYPAFPHDYDRLHL